MRRRGGTIQKTRKDGTCLLCSHNAQWLQTIPCGHTFCRGCITPYRKTSNPEEYHCPQCRKDIPPHAIQLVYTDKSGKLQIEGSAVEICFADPKVSEFPIHVISVIGVRHLGKSFLLNFILRALANQEKGEQNILGEWNESLTGFEWGSRTDSITRGIWIWNRPFILEFKGKKVAVFVLDTEGSLDIGRSEDISIKLSALSMVLSSYLIFNVHSLLNSTTLDYLEIYLTFAKEIEESSDGLCLQHLNILLRDWQDLENCRKEDGNDYIHKVLEKLKKLSQYQFVKSAVQNQSVSCSILPHPGNKMLMSGQGRLSDMDPIFRDFLSDYLYELVNGLRRYIKTNDRGETVTCLEMRNVLKALVNVLQKKECNLLSPVQMYHTMENYMIMTTCTQQFLDFLGKMNKEYGAFKTFFTRPSKVNTKITNFVSMLCTKYKEHFKGCNKQKEQFMQEMKAKLVEDKELYINKYTERRRKMSVRANISRVVSSVWAVLCCLRCRDKTRTNYEYEILKTWVNTEDCD